MLSGSHGCREHAVQCCSVQGDQSSRLKTQKTSQKSKLPFSTKAGSDTHTPLACFAVSPLELLSCSQVCAMTWTGKAALASSTQQCAVAMAALPHPVCPLLSPLSQHWQMGCSPTPPQSGPAKSPQNLAAGLNDLKSHCEPSHCFPKRLPK